METAKAIKLLGEAKKREVTLRITFKTGKELFLKNANSKVGTSDQLEVQSNGDLTFKDVASVFYSHVEEISSIRSSYEGYGPSSIDPNLEN